MFENTPENTPENLSRLYGVRCFVLDMDGTFYLGDSLLQGSLDFWRTVRESGRRVLFLTNNSSRNARHYVAKLNRMGCPAGEADVLTSGMATCFYLQRHFAGKRVHLLGNESLMEEFRWHGVTLDDNNPEVVVTGYDTTLTYAKLCRTCDHIRSGLPYISTHPDYNCPTETGFVPDLGSFGALIAASTGRQPDIVIGKPNAEIVRAMLEMTGLSQRELCICGDRLYTDIATGARNGILSVCVLTGEATAQDIAQSTVQPDLVFDRLADICRHL